MFKQIVILCLITSCTQHNQVYGKVQLSQNPVECYSIEVYKATLQHHIERENWKAVQQTYENMKKFLDSESNQRVAASMCEATRYVKAITAGGASLLPALIACCTRTWRPASISAFLICIAVSLQNLVRAKMVTPENVFNKDKKWLRKTIEPVQPKLQEFIDKNSASIPNKK